MCFFVVDIRGFPFQTYQQHPQVVFQQCVLLVGVALSCDTSGKKTANPWIQMMQTNGTVDGRNSAITS